MIIKQAMILSAGEGRRMRPLSENCPKPLLALGEQRIIDHVIDMLHDNHITKIALNIFQHKEQFTNLAHVTKFQEHQLLDSGGGINNMLISMLPDAFFSVNGDGFIASPTIPILSLMSHIFDMARMDCLMLLSQKNQVIGDAATGDYDMDDDGKLTRSSDKSGQYFYCGIQILNPAIFNHQYNDNKIFSMRDIWDKSQQDNRLYGVLLPKDAWCYHIGTPNALKISEKHLYG